MTLDNIIKTIKSGCQSRVKQIIFLIKNLAIKIRIKTTTQTVRDFTDGLIKAVTGFMKIGDLKLKLMAMGVLTHAFCEKSEFVRAYA